MRSTTLIVAAIVIAAMFVMPATADVKYFHTSLPPGGQITDPLGVTLHELYPNYCDMYNLSSWYDNNNDDVLDFCDVIDITEIPVVEGEEKVTYWHVEEVTVTLTVALEIGGEPMYLDYMGEEVRGYPYGTWHEIHPEFCKIHTLVVWTDSDGNGILDYCDYIELVDEDGVVSTWHVEEEATIDIVVRTMCLGECYELLGCNGTMLGVMPCWQCLGTPDGAVPSRGLSWKNHRGPACIPPCNGSKIRCWNETCPECCDGINNDGDNLVDCDGGPAGTARDPECMCCTDLSESIRDDCGYGTAEPCIPEAATIALVGVGILGIIGIGLRRREL